MKRGKSVDFTGYWQRRIADLKKSHARVSHWKMGGSGRIFREWRQLSDAIAAPSTNALKQSS
jgi:hypothetical protein